METTSGSNNRTLGADILCLGDVPRDRPLYVFGAGSGGRTLLRALRRAGGYDVARVLDRSRTGFLDDVEVVHPDTCVNEVSVREGNALFLLASEHHREMAAYLESHGISAARNALPLIERIVRTDPNEAIRRRLDELRPDTMIIDIAATCNARCPFCSRSFMPTERAEGYMDMETYEGALTEAGRAGIRWIRLYSAGEPLLHPRFSEMVMRAKERGFLVEVSTNGHNLHRHLEALLAVDVLQFSIDGWDRESFEYLRRPLRFDKVHRELAEFTAIVKDRAPAVPRRSIHLHVTRETDIEAFVALWGEFADDILISPAYPTPDVVGGRIVQRVEDPRLRDILFPVKPSEGFLVCSYPFSAVTVGYDGRIILCCTDFHASLELGRISDGIEAIQASEAMRKARVQFHEQRFPICAECPALCQVVPSDEYQQMRERAHRLAERVGTPHIRVNL